MASQRKAEMAPVDTKKKETVEEAAWEQGVSPRNSCGSEKV